MIHHPFERIQEFDYLYDVSSAISDSDAQNIKIRQIQDIKLYDQIHLLADRESLGISINSNYIDSEKFDEVLLKLAQLPNLKDLEIYTRHPINGQILSQIQSLEYLRIKSYVAQPISLSLPNLRILILEEIPNLLMR